MRRGALPSLKSPESNILSLVCGSEDSEAKRIIGISERFWHKNSNLMTWNKCNLHPKVASG